jgi:hypothetical protein
MTVAEVDDAEARSLAFRVSRLMEFCRLRELQNQTGHQYHDWPLVILKELDLQGRVDRDAGRPREAGRGRTRKAPRDHVAQAVPSIVDPSGAT